MARPKAPDLTDRELAVMQIFWEEESPITADEAREQLTQRKTRLAYATVANVIRALCDKGYLKQTNQKRPFCFVAAKSKEAVSRRLVGDLVKRVFQGSREAMLVNLFDQRELTPSEREYLTELLSQDDASAEPGE